MCLSCLLLFPCSLGWVNLAVCKSCFLMEWEGALLMQHLLKGMLVQWGRPLILIFPRGENSTGGFPQHTRHGHTMRKGPQWEIRRLVFFYLAFHSPEVPVFTTVRRGGSWQSGASAHEEPVVSWSLSKEQMGTQPAAAVLDQMMEPHAWGMRFDLLT